MREDDILPYEVVVVWLVCTEKKRRGQAYPYEVDFLILGYKAPPKQTAMFVKEENFRRRSRHPQTLNKTAK